ncbi:MAG: hypothetical protein NTV01_07545, partial [Bacteroidia bacterium]|nr:hypothetical protein [Bacteroidia bacterium]
MLQIPLISLALLLVATVTIGLAFYALANLKVRGGLEFCLLMVSLTFYIAGFGMELLTPTREGILFWLKIEYVGISTIPAFCILLAIRLAGDDNWLKWWPLRIVLLYPLVNLILYYTNSWHLLFYKSIGDQVHNVLTYCYELDTIKGAWYYVNIVYLNLGLLTAVILFVRKLSKDTVERRQAWILIGGSLGPWIAHLLYQSGVTKGFDIGPFGFIITAPLFAWGVFGNYVVFLLPKARDSVYQSFGDAVFISDNQMNLIDFNKTAGSLFKVLSRSSIGKPLSEVFGKFPEVANVMDGSDNQRIQARISIDNVRRSFIITNSSVNTRQNQRLGFI